MTEKMAVLGSTGSIGTQTLEVARMHEIKVTALAAHRNIQLLEQQAREFRPKIAAVFDEEAAKKLKIALADTNIQVFSGKEGMNLAAAETEADTVVNGIVGVAGLLPTLTAIQAKKNIALANKETLVAGGKIVMQSVKEYGVKLYPVDSEHSAIFQCLQGCPEGSLKKVILTASGGSFFGKKKEELQNVYVEDALKHPNWSMGQKISIDCSTMMNKGLEVIEASWLFDVPDEKIDVLVHRESIIHSMIQLEDNSVIAQLGLPDMKIPIQYALTYPERLPSPAQELNLSQIGSMSFYQPDYETFKCLAICRKALQKGGLYPTAVNAANEAAVALFLERKISFLKIADIAEEVFDNFEDSQEVTLENILEVNQNIYQSIYYS